MEANEIVGKIRKSNITLVSKETGIDSHRISILLKFPTEMTKDEKEILNMYFSYPRPDEKTAEELTKNLHENLKSLIRESGIEPDDICKRTGIAVSTIYRIRRDAYIGGISMGIVTKLSDFFNVSEIDLIFEKYDPSWLNRKPISGKFKPFINLSKAFSSDPKYVKILKVVALQNIFEKFGIKYKDLLKEISVIADL